MSKEKVILASMVSALGGAVIGLLFAPNKGEDTRKLIAEEGDKYLQDLKKNLEELREELNENVEARKSDIDRMSKDAQKKGQDFMKKAKKMTSYEEWTKDELYAEAKAREIENYSTMNKSELINALRNSKKL